MRGDRSPLVLGKLVGRGGEGDVWAVRRDDGLVAKLYTGGKAPDRETKVKAMLAAAQDWSGVRDINLNLCSSCAIDHVHDARPAVNERRPSATRTFCRVRGENGQLHWAWKCAASAGSLK
jgi:hypothetical protein